MRGRAIVLLEDQDLYAYSLEHRGDHFLDADSARALPPQSFSENQKVDDHSTSQRSDLFHLSATPRITPSSSTPWSPASYGAIRPGGPVDLFSRGCIGLLLNWAFVGFLDGARVSFLPRAPRLFKFVGGFLSDCLPLNRYRRKPYMLIGWSEVVLFMAGVTTMSEVKDSPVRGVACQGPQYLGLLLCGMFGHLICVTACEGLMIKWAHREGELVRGRTPTWCFIARFTGESIGVLATSFALNNHDYGGSFAYVVPIRAVFGVYIVVGMLGLLVTTQLIREERTPASSQHLVSQVRCIWSVLQKPMTWKITLVGFLVNIAFLFKIDEFNDYFIVWLGASRLALASTSVAISVGKASAAALFLVCLLNANWRAVVLVAGAAGLLVTVPVEVVTILDVFRLLALNLTKYQMVAVFDGLMIVTFVLVAVEAAEPGYEAVSYGIITTVDNLGNMVMSMTKNLIATSYDKRSTDLQLDTSEVRAHVMSELVFKYTLRFVVTMSVWRLLPRQKRHLELLTTRSTPNIVLPSVCFAVFAALLLVSITAHWRSSLPRRASCSLAATAVAGTS